MHLPTLILPLTLALTATASKMDILRPRNWDLRLLQPGCDTSASNIDISIFHRSGIGATSCASITEDPELNVSQIDTISWKSPDETSQFDLCVFSDPGCRNGSFVGAVRDGWSVCLGYQGWTGWRVVGHGGSCV